MSTRTFFRYFRSKDEVLLEAIYMFRERFLTNLEGNLPARNLWEAISFAIETSMLDCRNSSTAKEEREMQELIRGTPSLLARQLEVLEKLKIEAASLCMLHSAQATKLDECTTHAVIGSAFACYHSIHLHTRADTPADAVAAKLSDLMRALKPAILQT
jgi:AcrR family transcriptional regulator